MQGLFNSASSPSSSRTGRELKPSRSAMPIKLLRSTPLCDTDIWLRNCESSYTRPWYPATMARQARPHSLASDCSVIGRRSPHKAPNAWVLLMAATAL